MNSWAWEHRQVEGKKRVTRVRRNTKQAVMARCPPIAHFPLPPLIPHTLCSCDVHSNPPRLAVGVCSPIHPYASVLSTSPSSSPAPTPILNELLSQRCDLGCDSWWREGRMLDNKAAVVLLSIYKLLTSLESLEEATYHSSDLNIGWWSFSTWCWACSLAPSCFRFTVS